MIQGSYRYIAQESVVFGIPAAEALLQQVEARKADRVFVVTGRSLSRKTTIVSDVVARLGPRFAGLYDECAEHAPRETVIALAARLRQTGADLVATIGGGTPIDTVKVALLCLATGVTSAKQLDDWSVKVGSDGSFQVPQVEMGSLRQIAIPTTLSGAEFSDTGGSTDTALGVKHAFTAPGSCPVAVILDPATTVHTPEQLWLSTGIRAIDHAVETICSINAQPFTDATCLEALRRMAISLPLNRSLPHNLSARLDSQLGVWLASSGINRTEFGASHGIGHVLGGALHIPHGITSCVLLPAVLNFNYAATQVQQRRIADVFDSTTASEGVHKFIAALGLPTRLRDLIPDQRRFPELAKKALSNRWVRTNPVSINTEEDVTRLLLAAW
jgi:maleylacetate reductase